MLPSPPQLPVPPAPSARLPLSRWRDPRLILGLLIVAGSVLLGSWALAAADDTVTLWGVRVGLPAGVRIEAGDLERREVRFVDGVPDQYLPVTAEVVGRVVSRSVGAGELLPAAVVAATTEPARVQLPLSVDQTGIPDAVRRGSVVDVWLAPRDPHPDGTRARRVLREVVVVEVPDPADPLAPVSVQSVVVAVDKLDDVAAVLGAAVDGRLVLTLRGQR